MFTLPRKTSYGSRYSRIDQVKMFKSCFWQISLGPFLNTLTHISSQPTNPPLKKSITKQIKFFRNKKPFVIRVFLLLDFKSITCFHDTWKEIKHSTWFRVSCLPKQKINKGATKTGLIKKIVSNTCKLQKNWKHYLIT